jgi:predicted nucleotidyltransferase
MPPDQKVKMNLLGFEEAFTDSINVRIAEEPILEVPFVSPLGFAILKIISWADRYEQSYKDAYDLNLVLRNYADLGNDERIYDVEEILNQEDFDYETAGAMLLGHDIATLANDKTLKKIVEILDNEINDSGEHRLIENMQSFNSIGNFESDLKLLRIMTNALKIRVSP